MAHLIWVQLIKLIWLKVLGCPAEPGQVTFECVSVIFTDSTVLAVTGLGCVLLWPHLASFRVMLASVGRLASIFLWCLSPFFSVVMMPVLFPEFSQARRAPGVTQWSEGGLFICKTHTDWTQPLRAYQVSVAWNLSSVSLHGPRCYPCQLMFQLLRCCVTFGKPN